MKEPSQSADRAKAWALRGGAGPICRACQKKVLIDNTGAHHMNAQQALDLATDNGIVVTVDSELRDCTAMRRVIATEFKVGDYIISRGRGQNRWSIISGKSGGTFCYPAGPNQGKTILLPRGEAMQFAIELTLGGA